MRLLGPEKTRIRKMTALTKLIVHKNRILVMVLKNCSNEIRINEIRIRRELTVC